MAKITWATTSRPASWVTWTSSYVGLEEEGGYEGHGGSFEQAGLGELGGFNAVLIGPCQVA